MATNSRQARKEAERKLQISNDYYTNYLNQFYNNSVVIENPPLIPKNSDSREMIEIPKRYLLGILRDYGGIAYDKITGLYLRYTKREIDVYGLPKKYNLYGYNGYIIQRDAADVIILRANDLEYPIEDYIIMQAKKLSDCDNAIFQNLDACKTMSVVQVNDEKQLLSLINMENSRRIGASLVFSAKGPNINDAFKVANTGAQYLSDKMWSLRQNILNETLTNLGYSQSNNDKRERIQSYEIASQNAHGVDAINVLIDTFNYDAEYGGLDIRLKANTESVKIQETFLIDNDREEQKGENNDLI